MTDEARSDGTRADGGVLGALRFTWRIYERFEGHDGSAMAGYVAFSAFLSLFPFMIFFFTLAGILLGPEDSRAALDALFDLAPEHIARTLVPVMDEVLGQRRGGLLTISALGGVWVASNAVEAIRVAFDRAYESPNPRGFFRRRLIALAFVLLAALTFTVLGVLIILAPLGFRLAREYLGFEVPIGVAYLRYAFGLVTFAGFLYALNRVLPSRSPKSRNVWPGIVVTTALWVAGASGFSIYLAYAPSYTMTYGAFAGVIVTLLFFYLTSAMLIFGAEVNAALMARRGDVGSQTEEVV
ncbi:YihY/virulence factor BrkB family protein [Pikeienuella piscinae]|uniref:YihY/virulence factor BrkB family protein n=1 Tax=Pikeienuella piscinae TaxID=2748098 RepID=A0A7L5BTU0_9RHOB|nr:YihY/virulence factor BrkB family protein [Pikeienuella piscinae]QIE54922.1 YihY/virulence factor BrkB family protein [Pikeienuella piscinae]